MVFKSRKVTKWYTVADNGDIEFHHLEDGWCISETKPKPINDVYGLQKNWEKLNWAKRLSFKLGSGALIELRA